MPLSRESASLPASPTLPPVELPTPTSFSDSEEFMSLLNQWALTDDTANAASATDAAGDWGMDADPLLGLHTDDDLEPFRFYALNGDGPANDEHSIAALLEALDSDDPPQPSSSIIGHPLPPPPNTPIPIDGRDERQIVRYDPVYAGRQLGLLPPAPAGSTVPDGWLESFSRLNDLSSQQLAHAGGAPGIHPLVRIAEAVWWALLDASSPFLTPTGLYDHRLAPGAPHPGLPIPFLNEPPPALTVAPQLLQMNLDAEPAAGASASHTTSVPPAAGDGPAPIWFDHNKLAHIPGISSTPRFTGLGASPGPRDPVAAQLAHMARHKGNRLKGSAWIGDTPADLAALALALHLRAYAPADIRTRPGFNAWLDVWAEFGRNNPAEVVEDVNGMYFHFPMNHPTRPRYFYTSEAWNEDHVVAKEFPWGWSPRGPYERMVAACCWMGLSNVDIYSLHRWAVNWPHGTGVPMPRTISNDFLEFGPWHPDWIHSLGLH